MLKLKGSPTGRLPSLPETQGLAPVVKETDSVSPLVAVDYSEVERRALAHMSKDEIEKAVAQQFNSLFIPGL